MTIFVSLYNIPKYYILLSHKQVHIKLGVLTTAIDSPFLSNFPQKATPLHPMIRMDDQLHITGRLFFGQKRPQIARFKVDIPKCFFQQKEARELDIA